MVFCNFVIDELIHITKPGGWIEFVVFNNNNNNDNNDSNNNNENR